MNNIVITKETITPELASKIIETSELSGFHNRNLSSYLINKYATDIINGEWKNTGQTISITEDGKLIDGNHRLHAVIKANIPIDFVVARNVPEESFDKYDIGKTRQLSDVLTILGYTKYSRHIAGALKLFVGYLRFGEKAFKRNQYFLSTITQKDVIPILKIYYPVFEEAAFLYSKKKNNKLISLGNLLFFYVLFGSVNKEKRDIFFQDIISGLNLKEDCATSVLRNFLIQCKTSKFKQINFYDESFLIIKAWNKFYNNENCQYIRGLKNEKFPDICGFNKQKFLASLQLTPEEKNLY